jgi:hypothetical protein
MKVKIATADCYYYPDISVTCDKQDMETNLGTILNRCPFTKNTLDG